MLNNLFFKPLKHQKLPHSSKDDGQNSGIEPDIQNIIGSSNLEINNFLAKHLREINTDEFVKYENDITYYSYKEREEKATQELFQKPFSKEFRSSENPYLKILAEIFDNGLTLNETSFDKKYTLNYAEARAKILGMTNFDINILQNIYDTFISQATNIYIKVVREAEILGVQNKRKESKEELIIEVINFLINTQLDESIIKRIRNSDLRDSNKFRIFIKEFIEAISNNSYWEDPTSFFEKNTNSLRISQENFDLVATKIKYYLLQK